MTSSAVMCDAFRDYPVMRFIVGEGHGDYDNRLRQLVAYFVYRRVALNAPVFGMVDRGSVVAAATMTPPAEPDMPADVIARRDAAWAALGDEARLRYEAYAAATKPFTIASPHHHLNMIGVRHSHMGQGLARPLLEAAAAQSDDDPGSSGVSLTTELPRNLTLYQYLRLRDRRARQDFVRPRNLGLVPAGGAGPESRTALLDAV